MSSFLGALMNHGVPTLDSGLLQTRASSRTRWTLVCTAYLFVCVRVCERSRERAMRRIWEPCSFVGQQGVCTVCFPTFYIFMYPHLQIAVSVDAFRRLAFCTECIRAHVNACGGVLHSNDCMHSRYIQDRIHSYTFTTHLNAFDCMYVHIQGIFYHNHSSGM